VKRVTKTNIPDAYEVRLLLGQQIGKYIEFACNGFFDQAIGGDRQREIGFSTAASYAIRGEALKIGLETNYRNLSQQGQRRNSKNIFELGPAFNQALVLGSIWPHSLAPQAIHPIWSYSLFFRLISGPALSGNRKAQLPSAADSSNDGFFF
jgi:hypothetical protein